jgi:hypothetical protein
VTLIIVEHAEILVMLTSLNVMEAHAYNAQYNTKHNTVLTYLQLDALIQHILEHTLPPAQTMLTAHTHIQTLHVQEQHHTAQEEFVKHLVLILMVYVSLQQVFLMPLATLIIIVAMVDVLYVIQDILLATMHARITRLTIIIVEHAEIYVQLGGYASQEHALAQQEHTGQAQHA